LIIGFAVLLSNRLKIVIFFFINVDSFYQFNVFCFFVTGLLLYFAIC